MCLEDWGRRGEGRICALWCNSLPSGKNDSVTTSPQKLKSISLIFKVMPTGRALWCLWRVEVMYLKYLSPGSQEMITIIRTTQCFMHYFPIWTYWGIPEHKVFQNIKTSWRDGSNTYRPSIKYKVTCHDFHAGPVAKTVLPMQVASFNPWSGS